MKVNITFRRISNQGAFQKLLDFLKEDVVANGGSASEIVDMHGRLVQVLVCAVPWGLLVVNREMTKLEAIAWFMTDEEV